MSSFWKNKKVLVTGGAGFIGSHLVEILVAADADVTVPVRSLKGKSRYLDSQCPQIKVVDADLMDFNSCLKLTEGQDVVMNLAATVGGIEFNLQRPAFIFRENLQVFMNVIEAARCCAVERLLVTSSACVYPRFCSIPTPEDEGFKERPEPSNEGYGWAKRMEEFLGMAYLREYGTQVAIARPYNAYGPRDNFDPSSSHVIPALIRRIVGGENPLIVWGDGSQSRSFLYVTDFARGLMEVAEKYAVGDAVNIGSDEEVTIADLSRMIVELSGTDASIEFDTSKPMGQPRRKCDTAKAKANVGYESKVPLREGLAKTIDWYRGECLQ